MKTIISMAFYTYSKQPSGIADVTISIMLDGGINWYATYSEITRVVLDRRELLGLRI